MWIGWISIIDIRRNWHMFLFFIYAFYFHLEGYIPVCCGSINAARRPSIIKKVPNRANGKRKPPHWKAINYILLTYFFFTYLYLLYLNTFPILSTTRYQRCRLLHGVTAPIVMPRSQISGASTIFRSKPTAGSWRPAKCHRTAIPNICARSHKTAGTNILNCRPM